MKVSEKAEEIASKVGMYLKWNARDKISESTILPNMTTTEALIILANEVNAIVVYEGRNIYRIAEK